MNDKDTTYGVIGVIMLIALVGWGLISSSHQQQKEANTETISSAVSDINYKIDDLYTSATDTYGSIDDECSWQADNLSGNIGDVCSNNTVESYSIDSEDSYQLGEDTYTQSLDDGESIDDTMAQLIDDANTNYDNLLSTPNVGY